MKSNREIKKQAKELLAGHWGSAILLNLVLKTYVTKNSISKPYNIRFYEFVTYLHPVLQFGV